MDPILIVTAFIFNALSSCVGLPLLVGFLAGFVTNSLEIKGGEQTENTADTGVALMHIPLA